MTDYHDPELIAYVADGTPKDDTPSGGVDYRNSTYMVVSKFAYLIGVPKSIFDNEHEPPQSEWYEKLRVIKNARIIRNLCMLRTAIECNFGKISRAMQYDLKNLHSLPEYVPQACLAELLADGIEIEKANVKPNQYIIDLNGHIANRINNCKELFPIWLNWEYIRRLFIMPDGLSELGVKRAANEYYERRSTYPYQVYLNWSYSASGNILYNDKKFVTLLYEANEDRFHDLSKVSDAGNVAKAGIYRFLENSEGVVVLVDCENSDPYKLYATLNNLDQNALLSKIGKIVLYDDVHAASAWSILEDFTDLPIEYVLIDRIKENKSLADIRLTACAVREHYVNGVKSFILVSSDSDYWGLITELPTASFLVMVESMKCGPDIKRALQDKGFTYCYIDDFCTGNSNEIKIAALTREIRGMLDDALSFNINEALEEAYRRTRADMSDAERRRFYEKYIKRMHLVIDSSGELYIELGEP